MFGLEDKKQHVVGDFRSKKTSERHSTGFNSDAAVFFDIPSDSAVAESNPRRSRPSFLDSLNTKDSSLSGRSFVDKDKFTDSDFSSGSSAVSSAIHIPSIAFTSIDPLPTPASYKSHDVIFSNESKQQNSFGRYSENKLDFTSQKQMKIYSSGTVTSLFLMCIIFLLLLLWSLGQRVLQLTILVGGLVLNSSEGASDSIFFSFCLNSRVLVDRLCFLILICSHLYFFHQT